MLKKIYSIYIAAAFCFILQSSAISQNCKNLDAITTATLKLTNQSNVCETTADLFFTYKETNGERQFFYGITTSYGTNGENIVGSARNTAIKLTGLEPGTQYFFKVIAKYNGSTKYTMTGTFTTNANTVINTPPELIALPDSFEVTADQTATFTVQAKDADKDQLQFTYSNLPAWVTTNDSVITFQPQTGNQPFTFKVSVADGKGGVAQDSMIVWVRPSTDINRHAIKNSLSTSNATINIGKNMVTIPSCSDLTLSVQLFSINGSLVFKHDINIDNHAANIPRELFNVAGTYLCKITGAHTSHQQMLTFRK